MSILPPEYLDANTPPDVIVTDRARPAITDPLLGEPLGARAAGVPSPPSAPLHRLVAVGDSLTHGMSSGAVFHTQLSYPALVAESLGVRGFAVPSYAGPLGGLPLNLEGLLRELQQKFGRDLGALDWLRLPLSVQQALDRNEDYWERGAGHDAPRTDVHYENLGIYGWDVRDALSFTAARAAAGSSEPTQDSFTGATPEHDNDIAARSVLAPFGSAATQLDAAAWHGRNGGIDVLTVVLGANNALRSVVDKRVLWSGPNFASITGKGGYNVWRPSHFAAEYAELVRAVREIPARRVVLGTVPHVTVAPIARGVNPQQPGEKWRAGSRFFPYYTDPWISDRDFNPRKHRHLTHQQARAIDSAIDQYNELIVDTVRHARREGLDWRVLDLCGVLDGLAQRRFVEDPAAAERNDWVPFRLAAPIADLDTRFFTSDESGRTQGGLFGLDAVHPTVSGYGIMAQALLDVIWAGEPGPAPAVDFAALRAKDSLNTSPPALLNSVLSLLEPFLTVMLTRR